MWWLEQTKQNKVQDPVQPTLDSKDWRCGALTNHCRFWQNINQNNGVACTIICYSLSERAGGYRVCPKQKQIKCELVRGPVMIGDWEQHSPKTVELVKEKRNTLNEDHTCHNLDGLCLDGHSHCL